MMCKGVCGVCVGANLVLILVWDLFLGFFHLSVCVFGFRNVVSRTGGNWYCGFGTSVVALVLT